MSNKPRTRRLLPENTGGTGGVADTFRRCLVLVLIIAAVLLPGTAGWSMLGGRVQKDFEERMAGPEAGLRRADSLIAGGESEKAIPILEDLSVIYPGSQPVLANLARAYLGAGRSGKAAHLIERAMEKQGARPGLVKLLGMAYLDMGKKEKAVRVWRSLLHPGKESDAGHLEVSGLLWDAGFYQRALDVLREGSSSRKLYGVCMRRIVELERLLGEYGKAFADEAERIRVESGGRVGNAGRLLEIFEESGRDTTLLRALEKPASGSGGRMPDSEMIRSLLMARAGMFGRAMDLLEQAAGRSGREASFYSYLSLLSRMEEGRGGGELDGFRTEAFGLYLETFSEGGMASSVRLMKAELDMEAAVRMWPHDRRRLSRALDELSLIDSDGGGRPYSDRARILMARIWLEGLNQPEKALPLLKKQGWLQAGLRKRADILRARALSLYLNGAENEKELEGLARSRDPEVSAEAAFRLSQRFLYTGRYSRAVEGFSALADTFRTSPRANDALEAAMLVKKAMEGPRRPLDLYASARLSVEKGAPFQALDSLAVIRNEYPEASLLPWAVMEICALQQLTGTRDKALEGYQWLAETFPGHLCSRRALEELGDALAEDSPAEAAAWYKRAMERYPQSPFISRVRAKFMNLKKRIEPDESGSGVKNEKNR